MTGYGVARALYHLADRWILQRVPESVERWLREHMLTLARALFRGRIRARSVDEFIAGSRRQLRRRRLPHWAEEQLRALAPLEPSLTSLIGPDADIGERFIPWTAVHAGKAFAAMRRPLRDTYACMLLLGAEPTSALQLSLDTLPRPLLVVHTHAADAAVTQPAADGIDHATLPAAELDREERVTVLVRLILQLQPGELHHARDAFIELCVQRHGLALSEVSRLVPLDPPRSR